MLQMYSVDIAFFGETCLVLSNDWSPRIQYISSWRHFSVWIANNETWIRSLLVWGDINASSARALADEDAIQQQNNKNNSITVISTPNIYFRSHSQFLTKNSSEKCILEPASIHVWCDPATEEFSIWFWELIASNKTTFICTLINIVKLKKLSVAESHHTKTHSGFWNSKELGLELSKWVWLWK